VSALSLEENVKYYVTDLFFPNFMNEKACQLMYILLNDVTLLFFSFGGVEILKQIIIELILVHVRERIFQLISIF